MLAATAVCPFASFVCPRAPIQDQFGQTDCCTSMLVLHIINKGRKNSTNTVACLMMLQRYGKHSEHDSVRCLKICSFTYPTKSVDALKEKAVYCSEAEESIKRSNGGLSIYKYAGCRTACKSFSLKAAVSFLAICRFTRHPAGI